MMRGDTVSYARRGDCASGSSLGSSFARAMHFPLAGIVVESRSQRVRRDSFIRRLLCPFLCPEAPLSENHRCTRLPCFPIHRRFSPPPPIWMRCLPFFVNPASCSSCRLPPTSLRPPCSATAVVPTTLLRSSLVWGCMHHPICRRCARC
ncbi:hypothetical protein B0H12DRAFT_126509 [Mycena haematopus]|nr:hypothetical protein B0H12DRAFT_126509 [Mycena haematopus]